MTQDEAEKLADLERPFDTVGDDVLITIPAANLRILCDYILSGNMRGEIENAAYERAAKRCSTGVAGKWCADQIRSLIQPPAQKEDGK